MAHEDNWFGFAGGTGDCPDLISTRWKVVTDVSRAIWRNQVEVKPEVTVEHRFTFWGTEGVAGAGGASGAGFAMSFDQQMGPITPFFRYSTSNHSGLTRIRQVASAGFGLQNPFGNEGDVFGVGLAWARPDAVQANDEYVVETFYRIQVTPTLQFTPDVQLIINPSLSSKDVVGVLGLRFRIQY